MFNLNKRSVSGILPFIFALLLTGARFEDITVQSDYSQEELSNKQLINEAPSNSYFELEELAKVGRYVESEGVVDYETFQFPVINGHTTEDNYPVFLIRCEQSSRTCFNLHDAEIGSFELVSKFLLKVRNEDIISGKVRCKILCFDSENNLVGSISPSMYIWINTNVAERTIE